MDSSNRLMFLLGNLRVHPSEVTPTEWAEIMQRIAAQSKPKFKYLGPRPIAEFLNCSYDYFSGPPTYAKRARVTAPELIEYPLGISEKSRCIQLHDDRKLGEVTSLQQCQHHRRGLLLIEGDRFVEWRGLYDQAEQCNTIKVIETAVSCTLTELKSEGLVQYLGFCWGTSKDPGPAILAHLNKFWGQVILDRRENLEAIQGVHNLVNSFRNRMCA